MKFLDNELFELSNIEKNKSVYFPLCNENIKGSITPLMNGDLKTDHHHFALEPSSNNQLLNNNNCRNVWFKTENFSVNIIGDSIEQLKKQDKVKVKYGFLFQEVTRTNKNYKIDVKSYIPLNFDTELHKVKYTNTSKKEVKLSTFISVPLYGRSADNLRDHRHVTALLNRVTLDKNAINNTPTFSFDERGHIINDVIYSVTASENNEIKRFYPTVDCFIGNGSFQLPDAIYKEVSNDYQLDGFEVLGGIEYKEVTLQPNESFEFVYGISISKETTLATNKSVVSIEGFDKNFTIMQNYWLEKTSSLEFFTKDNETNNYLKWVTLQPTLRRIYGCSFLPHHDYGKGGRGFRDLWQDCLSLIKINPSEIKDSIINNFAAIRIDGSNATIIGSGVKDFKADRNDIVRMWMDHGVWPFLTTNTYLQTTNDYDMLLEKTSYFKDNHISFSQEIDREWDGCLQQKTKSNEEYEGTLLEHILVQNITSSYNLGKNKNIKLMDADWNDGLDMAHVNGESVSFTALYAQNLKDICVVIDKLKIKKVELFKELADLIEEDYVLDYEICKERLSNFFLSVKNKISGKTKSIDVVTLKNKLSLIYQSLEKNINENEWLENSDLGYYNGYYDNDGNKLESAKNSQMVLTSQVFQISSGIASDDKVQKIVDSADKLLYSKEHGGYRLNTNFNEVKTNMGRLFGFAYGHKENGAVFSHMAVMYANSLYKRNFVDAGYKVLNTIKESVCDYERSKMLPGIPEYFDTNGVGMYPYLTGSASWLLLTMTEEVFGVKRNGKILNLEPKLTSTEFNKNKLAIINFILDNKKITIKYKNKNLLEFNEYNVTKIKVNGKSTKKILIENLDENNVIEVTLS